MGRRLIISEQERNQIISLYEDYGINRYSHDDDSMLSPSELVRADWFNVNRDVLEPYQIKMVDDPIYFDKWFKESFSYLIKRYGNNLHRVVAQDNGKIIGYFIWADSNAKIEGVSDDTTSIPVVLSTAVSPEYRRQGILNKMIENSGIGDEYFLHYSDAISPEGFWEKKGCYPVHELNKINKIFFCGKNKRDF